ncbi:MAG TPA: hypothetical protein VMF70_08505 [Gemmatimonadales bacterium]|nr:hypothetical protein [Gemmatimonadales bacterium]
MSILAMLAFASALQQPTTARERALQVRRAAFDTSRSAIAVVAKGVADVRSALDVYRRAVFNSTDAEVLSMGDYLRRACRGLDSTATVAVRKVCRHCAFQPNVQTAFDGYRVGLPAVSRTAAGCAARLSRLARGSAPAKGMRRDVRVIGNPIVQTLQGYERRLHVVLVALNAAPG